MYDYSIIVIGLGDYQKKRGFQNVLKVLKSLIVVESMVL